MRQTLIASAVFAALSAVTAHAAPIAGVQSARAERASQLQPIEWRTFCDQWARNCERVWVSPRESRTLGDERWRLAEQQRLREIDAAIRRDRVERSKARTNREFTPREPTQ